MGTRANFFIGLGDNQKWLGSAFHDTYPDGLPKSLTHATSASGYRKAISRYLAEDPNDKIVAGAGGEPIGFRDYEYTFANGRVLVKEGFDPTYSRLSDKAPELFLGSNAPKKLRKAKRKKAPGGKRTGALGVKGKSRLQAEVKRLRKKLDTLVADINRLTR